MHFEAVDPSDLSCLDQPLRFPNFGVQTVRQGPGAAGDRRRGRVRLLPAAVPHIRPLPGDAWIGILGGDLQLRHEPVGGIADAVINDATGVSTFTGVTVTNSAVLGSDSAVFQPNADSTTFFQILDADGGTPIFNIDSTNERIGINQVAPSAQLDIESADGWIRSGTGVFTGGNSFDTGIESNHILWHTLE